MAVMDKSRQSSGDSTTTTASANSSSNTSTTTHSRDNYLRQLNKLSQKISKPIIKKPTFDSSQNQQQQQQQNHTFNNHNPPQAQAQQQNLQHHQPPVYKIKKSDFRDVVQKLTGSPSHERISSPPPIQHQPKPPSSRLQRIRPPPLAQISNRPPPPFLNAVAPLSPLPPFPTVHAAAESPISAYMRFLQNSMSSVDSNSKQYSGSLLSPRWNNLAPQQHQPEQQSQFQLPSSSVPFGCLNLPRSSYPLLSPSLVFSPSSGQLGIPQLPLSPPTVPVPSPGWKGL